MKIFIFFNYRNKEIVAFTNTLISILIDKSIKIDILATCKPYIKHNDVNIFDEKNSDYSLIISIGGDGTLIKASYYSIYKDIPIVGINMGRLGFLTTVDKDDLNSLFSIINGEYKSSRRMLIDVELCSNKNTDKFTCINDVVVGKAGISKICDLDVYYNDNYLTNYRCDGIIVSTPTGSTAYAMSVGGSIIDPKLSVLNLASISSHSSFNTPIVFNDNIEIQIRINPNNKSKIYLSVDGYDTSKKISISDVIKVRKSNYTLNLIENTKTDYYKIFCEKFINKGFNFTTNIQEK